MWLLFLRLFSKLWTRRMLWHLLVLQGRQLSASHWTYRLDTQRLLLNCLVLVNDTQLAHIMPPIPSITLNTL
ncbi:hypothetical protein MT325_m268R [Paramecium bursaria chlorella virus MT325]|uniref:Uncharacterized protein m268R n=2 Tax=Paramecium bursaria Chlorella virus A1 TaxID=381899 RepID=A7ITZ8_PBCVM|nr:hypothetical protein FR483_n273R [Paramecium bursaria Chlorella virus FR483]ABT13822.1 hypothetical protein MT325_m268R [Paramecium bursaria chlorella virus MT325]ABT15558.1 hypothetical protein FR483_n273R [Paramecium bursaria Chlorella virus FR483]